jgi:hypothetical protein
MKESSQNSSVTPDDIDLLQLAERCILFFRRYKWVFIIATILGLAAGFFFYKKMAKVYTSRMLLHSYMLSNPEQIQVVNTWNQLLQKREYDILAGIFHCDKNILYKTKRIKAKELQQVFTASNPNGFVIDAVVTNNDVLEGLQKGIIYGFENSVYIKERLDIRKSELEELIGKTNQEIQKLDSTKKMLENIISGKGKSASSLIIDGSSVNRQLIEMNEKLLSFREQLQFANAVQVLQGFQKFNKPSGPHLVPWLVIGLAVFLALAYVYALLDSIRAGLKKRALNRETK